MGVRGSRDDRVRIGSSAKTVSHSAVPDRKSGAQKGRRKADGSIAQHTYILVESHFIVLSTQKWPQYMHDTAHTPEALSLIHI